MNNEKEKQNEKNSKTKGSKIILLSSILLLVLSIILLLYLITISFNVNFQFKKIFGDVNSGKQFTIGFLAGDVVTTYGTAEIVATCGSLPKIEPPTRAGYKFLGYYWYEDGKKIYNADGTVASPSFCNPYGGEWILEAKWEKIETIQSYTVSFDINGADYSGYDNSISVEYGKDMPTLSEVPKKIGYKFLGYYADDTQYYKPDGTSARKYDVKGDMPLVAKWEKTSKNVYTITIDNNGIGDSYDVNGNKQLLKFKVEEGGVLPKIEVSKPSDYNLLGYYYKNKQYYNSNGKAVRNFEEKSDITVVAKWEKKTTSNVTNNTNTQNSNVQENNNVQTNSAGNTITDVGSFGKKIESNGLSITMPSFNYDDDMTISYTDVTNTTGNSLKSKFSNIKNIAIYNVSVGDYKINGTILEISLPIPSNFDINTLKVYSFDSSNNKINISRRISGNNVIFNTPTLGSFALVNFNQDSINKNESTTLFTSVNSNLVGGVKLSELDDSNLVFELADVTDSEESVNLKEQFKDMKDILIVNTNLKDIEGNSVNISNKNIETLVKIPSDWDSKLIEVYDVKDDNTSKNNLSASVNDTVNSSRVIIESKVSDEYVEFTTDHIGQFVIVQNENIKSNNKKIVNNKIKQEKNDIFWIGFIASIIGIVLSIILIIKYIKDKNQKIDNN